MSGSGVVQWWWCCVMSWGNVMSCVFVRCYGCGCDVVFYGWHSLVSCVVDVVLCCVWDVV